MSDPVRVIAVADSDSHITWGAALLSRYPSEWERSMVVLASPALPSDERLAAVLGDPTLDQPAIVDLAELAVLITTTPPDVVLLSLSGPLVEVALRAIERVALHRPIIVTGLSGISVAMPATAIAHRSHADLFVLHSRREVTEFAAEAARLNVRQRFALATLPSLPCRTPGQRADGDVIFAAQAVVPRGRADRLALLGWLAEAARRYPYRRVIVTAWADPGDEQNPTDVHDYARLLPQLTPRAPSNLVIATGATTVRLERAAALVTVGSTAAIAAVSLNVPVLVLGDFGVGAELENAMFLGSGLVGGCADLVQGRFKRAGVDWLRENYFHGVENDDWVAQTLELLALREVGRVGAPQVTRGSFAGMLRRVWDRKRALGRFDRSLSGGIALVIVVPLRMAFLAIRRARRLLRRRTVSP